MRRYGYICICFERNSQVKKEFFRVIATKIKRGKEGQHSRSNAEQGFSIRSFTRSRRHATYVPGKLISWAEIVITAGFGVWRQSSKKLRAIEHQFLFLSQHIIRAVYRYPP